MPYIDFKQAAKLGGMRNRDRGEKMIKDFRNKEDFGEYKYYRLEKGSSRIDTPIRLVIDKEGNEIGADTIDPDTGSLVRGAFMKEIYSSPHIEDISEAEFYVLCEKVMQKKQLNLNPGREKA